MSTKNKWKLVVPEERLAVESGNCCVCGEEIIGDKRLQIVSGNFYEYHEDSFTRKDQCTVRACWAGWKHKHGRS